MSKLSAYFRPTPAGRTKEVYLENFKDEGGNPLPFVLQSISAEENEAITKSCTDRNGKLDSVAYSNKVLVACLKEPDLKSSELCQFYGVIDPKSDYICLLGTGLGVYVVVVIVRIVPEMFYPPFGSLTSLGIILSLGSDRRTHPLTP